jgi:CBS domain-containing protein
MLDIPDNLKEVADKVHADGKPHIETVRTLLSWFNAQRRGYWVVRDIRNSLKHAKLTTDPDFELAYIDGEIAIQPSLPEILPETTAATDFSIDLETDAAIDLANQDSRLVIGGSVPDPVPRIGMLAAANTPPVYVGRDSEVREAISLMLMNDFSQLPVMQNERNVDGVISWRSIGTARALNKECSFVRQCMDTMVEIIDSSATLFSAIETIVRKEVVLVRGADKKITGLVTTSDISLQFGTLSAPFLLLGEIENHIRRIIDGKYSYDALSSSRDPSDENREIHNVADLTFGEYIRLLENPSNWQQLNYDLSRAIFVERLNKVRRIRNEVMHFHPDGISDDDLNLLRDMVKFMQVL